MITRKTLMLLAAFVGGIVLMQILPESWLFRGADREMTSTDEGMGGFACPMFCVVVEEMPGNEKCPVCGMKLAPVATESRLDAHERFMTGLQASRLEEIPLVRSVRLTGEVDYDEDLVEVLSARSSGWVESLLARKTWQEVVKDEEVLRLYSPELYAAQDEFLVLLAGGREVEIDAARTRLLLLGLAAAEIAELESSGELRRAAAIRAPRSGVVVRRQVAEGDAVMSGSPLLTIADLSRVWIQLEAFETDLESLRVGQEVVIAVATDTIDRRRGRIAFIDPVIDRRSRTARLRVLLDNERRPDGSWRFRPGQRVDARVDVALDRTGEPVAADGEAQPALAIPRSSVLLTGRRVVAFRLQGGGPDDLEFDPDALPASVGYELVELRIGPLARAADSDRLAEYYPVLETLGGRPGLPRRPPLAPGQVVVTEGGLLLDSQAQLAGRPSLLFPDGREATADPHAGH